MRALRLFFTRLRKQYLAFKLKREHDKAIDRTRSRWKDALRKDAIRHPATATDKPHK
jgi:hypothetical protein